MIRQITNLSKVVNTSKLKYGGHAVEEAADNEPVQSSGIVNLVIKMLIYISKLYAIKFICDLYPNMHVINSLTSNLW